MTYFPYIDGLRAVAILLVLFFHGGVKLFPSGFIGVDIFFVISGFLITGIIYNSLANNQFSFARFYSRRLWRLQPVFICLLLVTAVVALIYCLPDDLIQYSKSLRKTSLYISNIFFSNTTTGYFAPDGKQFPLLHTWSLSIEWQCYLILPLGLFLLYRSFGKEKVPKVIYVLTLLSFFLAFYGSVYHTAYTYYLLSSRIFEFLIGACVALNSSRLPLNKYFLNFITLLALFSLFYIATLEGVSLGFPNAYALIICAATAVLILVGNNSATNFVIRFLSLKWLVFIGLISYSLYIWHWPLFAFSRYMGLTENPLMRSIIFAITFIIAYCSWRFIEKPARNFCSLPILSTVALLIILPILLIHLGAYEVKKHEGFPARYSKVTSVFAEIKKYHNTQRVSCLVFKDTEISKDCAIGAKNKNSKTGLMIGDSFSNHYWLFIDKFAKQANLSILAQAIPSCLTLPGITQIEFLTKKGVYIECQKQTARYYEMIKNNHYSYVLISANWNAYLEEIITKKQKAFSPLQSAQRQMEKALDKGLQLITEAGSKPVLIKAIPLSHKGDPYLCFLKHIKQGTSYNPQDCDYKMVPEEQKWVNNLFAKMEKKYPQLIVIDPQKLLCRHGQCKADINNVPVFRDPAHLTDYASYYLAKHYLQRYKNPFTG